MKTESLFNTYILIISAVLIFHPSIANTDVHVYDKNNQYLGILMDLSTEDFDVFIPSLSASWGADYDEIEACPGRAFFELSSCSGTPYQQGPLPRTQDLSSSSLNGFYVLDYNQKNTFTPGSYIDSNCDCQPNGFYPEAEHYKLIEVQMPFATPIALPLRFEVSNEVRKRVVVIPLN